MLNKIAHQRPARIQILVLICEKSEGQVVDQKNAQNPDYRRSSMKSPESQGGWYDGIGRSGVAP